MKKQQQVPRTLKRLLKQHDLALLGQVRRLDGMLRDLHPDEPRAVGVIIEALECGVVSEVLRLERDPTADVQHAGLVSLLVSHSGLAAPRARWAVEVWMMQLLGHVPQGRTTHRRQRKGHSRVAERPGSLEKVLGATKRETPQDQSRAG